MAILLIVCLSISSVSATAIDNNNSGNEILNSTGMTTEDINTINDCSVAKNIESEDSVESNIIDQSSVNMDKSSVSSDSNLGSEAQSSNDAISKDNVASDNVAVDEDSNSDVKKAKSTSFTNAKSDDSSESDEKMSADDVNALNAVSVADDFESEDSQSDNSGISVSNLASESQASNDDTSDESIGSVSVPYEVKNTNGGMSDNIGQANVASQDDVSDSVMITSTEAAMSIPEGDVKSTEIVSLLTSQSVLTSGSTASSKVSISDIITGAIKLKQYVLKYNKLPSTVTVNGEKYSINVFTYLMSQAILSIDSSKTSKINVIKVTGPSDYSSSIYKNATKATYLKLAKTVADAGVNKKALPKYVTFSSKKADFKTYSFAFAKILAFKDSKNRLPSTCLFDSTVFKTSTKSSSVTVAQIIKAAKSLKSYTQSKKALPKTISVGGKKVTVAEFSYLMSQAINKINAKKPSAKIAIKKVTVSSTSASIYKNADKSVYLNAAKTVANAGVNKKVLPKYVTINGKKAVFKVYTYAFAKTLAFYDSKKRLPNTCLFDSSVFTKSPSGGSYVSVSQVATASKKVKAYVVSYKKLPKTVTVGNKKVSIETFSVLAARSIMKINAKNPSAKIKIVNVTKYSYSGQSISKTVDSAAVLNIAKKVSSSVTENKKVPKYVTIGGKKAGFNLYTYGLVKDLDFYKSKKRLANKVTFSSSAFSSSSDISLKKGINEKCTTKDLSVYLKAAGNCALNSQIKNLAKSLTKNCKTEKEKVNAIFKYVRDKVDYSFYYNSKKKASGALSSKKANCCDKANLVVALCRASGIAARYSHSHSVNFNSGLTCGHVWAQVKVGDYWLAADTTSSRNTLGHINNWNTGKLSGLNQYSLLPF